MPLTNGDVGSNVPQIALSDKALDHESALDFLQNEYKHQDGVDVQTLLDSRTNGGLTYNDFLVLPGYIGISISSLWLVYQHVDTVSRLPCLRCCS